MGEKGERRVSLGTSGEKERLTTQRGEGATEGGPQTLHLLHN